MTANQLRYWELRWKQYYESRKIEVDYAQLQLEARKVSETIRHNKAEERIAKQQNVLKSIELNHKWAELDFKIKQWIVGVGIDKIKLEQEQQKINIREKEVTIKEEEIKLQCEKILQSRIVAFTDLYKQGEELKNNYAVNTQKNFVSASGEFLKSFGGGAGALLAAEQQIGFRNNQIDAMTNELAKMYPDLVEKLGPQVSNSSKVGPKPEWQKNWKDKYDDWSQANPRLDLSKFGDDRDEKYYKEQEAKGDATSAEISKYLESVRNEGVKNSTGPSDIVSPSAESTTANNPVVYSEVGKSSSHTTGGTGYRAEGGIKSSGIIYA